jgi:hypothetical protein
MPPAAMGDTADSTRHALQTLAALEREAA